MATTSKCHNAPVKVKGNTTKYHVCNWCKKACDINKPKKLT